MTGRPAPGRPVTLFLDRRLQMTSSYASAAAAGPRAARGDALALPTAAGIARSAAPAAAGFPGPAAAAAAAAAAADIDDPFRGDWPHW